MTVHSHTKDMVVVASRKGCSGSVVRLNKQVGTNEGSGICGRGR